VAELMKAEGMEGPTPEQRQRFDRKRKKSLSNRDWVNRHDPEARITKMKDGRTPGACAGVSETVVQWGGGR
jgi:transposase